MNKDFRIVCGFLEHPKLLKLRTRLGDEGVIALLRIWDFAARYRVKGVFYDMSDEDLLLAANWSRDDLLETLVELRLLDRDSDGVLVIHDWYVHNGYAFHADERSERARRAAEKRWVQRADASVHDVDDGDADGNAQSNAGGIAGINAPSNAPSPVPDPDPVPMESRSRRGRDR